MSAAFNRSHTLLVNVADAEDLRRNPARSKCEVHCSCGLWKAGTDTPREYRELRKPFSARLPVEVLWLIHKLAVKHDLNATAVVCRAIREQARRDRVK